MHRRAAVPQIVHTAHQWPNQTDLTAIRASGSKSTWSDHATVEYTIQYTTTETPPHRWTMPLHVLHEIKLVNKMRSMATDAYAQNNVPAIERLFDLMNNATELTRENIAESTKKTSQMETDSPPTTKK